MGRKRSMAEREWEMLRDIPIAEKNGGFKSMRDLKERYEVAPQTLQSTARMMGFHLVHQYTLVRNEDL